MPNYKLTKVGLSLPDYFGGYHDPVLQVAVHRDMTKKELTDVIVNEYHMTYDHYTYEGHKKPWPDLSEEALRKMCNEFILLDKPFKNSDIPALAEYEEDQEAVTLFIICEEDDD